jgi:branched-chain amino acid transport system substrate-binding protein
MLKRRIAAGIIGISFVLVGCSGVNQPQTLKVAVSLPLGLDVGQDMLHGIELALQEHDGKAGDIPVELVVINTSDPEGSPLSPELETEAATQAVADAAVVAYLGPVGSGQARASMPLLNQAGILQISPSASWPGLTKPGYGPSEPGVYYPTGQRHFFRLAPPDDIQGIAAANWANELGFESAYIVDDGTAYGIGVTGIFEVTAEDLGIELLAHESFSQENVNEESAAALAQRIVDAEPALLYYGGGVEGGGSVLLRAVRTLKPDLNIMGADGLVQTQLITDNGAEMMAGVYGTGITVPADQLPSASAFATSFEAAYDKEPDPLVLAGYEGMQVILHVIDMKGCRSFCMSSIQPNSQRGPVSLKQRAA